MGSHPLKSGNATTQFATASQVVTKRKRPEGDLFIYCQKICKYLCSAIASNKGEKNQLQFLWNLLCNSDLDFLICQVKYYLLCILNIARSILGRRTGHPPSLTVPTNQCRQDWCKLTNGLTNSTMCSYLGIAASIRQKACYKGPQPNHGIVAAQKHNCVKFAWRSKHQFKSILLFPHYPTLTAAAVWGWQCLVRNNKLRQMNHCFHLENFTGPYGL